MRLVDLSKRFGGLAAVDRISLDIFQGEFFALLGPSGCGKTTLLRLLAGFETPDSGTITIDGEAMGGVPPYARPVNMMFQSYALFPHMNVERNVAFGLKQDRLPPAEIAGQVAEMLELVQLTPQAKRKPHQLSGGQRQRVALARSLIKQPKMLLLDEPLAALDKKLREQTQFELMAIQERVGITFIIVTHDQQEAMTVASRIAVMDRGRIAQVATPAEIYEAPNSRYVAEFIGDINLFAGRISGSAGEPFNVVCEEEGVTFEVVDAHGNTIGASVWVALRPEKIRIAATPPAAPTGNCLAGEVWDIGYLGSTSIYHVKLDSGKMITAVQTNPVRAAERPLGYRDRVYLSWSAAAAVVLPS